MAFRKQVYNINNTNCRELEDTLSKGINQEHKLDVVGIFNYVKGNQLILDINSKLFACLLITVD